MKSAVAVLFSASLIASAAAHGWVGKLNIAGKVYNGNKPTEETPNGAPSVIRQIANNLPVKDTTSPDLTCGASAKPASQVATAAAGDTIQVTWQTLAAGGLWFHDVGPMMTYLASCGSTPCNEFDASKARWFKIAEQGQDASGNWAQAKLDTGAPATVTLPKNLKAGNYLLRHEIIALHTAMTAGNAEFYPSCAQLTVTGSGTGAPAASELVFLPGAYKPTDPGILIDVYNMKGAYVFPGPKVAAFVSGAAPADGGATTPAATKATSTKAAATPTSTKAAATAGSGSSSKTTTAASSAPTCKSKRSAGRAAAPGPDELYARAAEAAAIAARAAAPEPLDVRAEMRRSRMRHLHRAVQRSF